MPNAVLRKIDEGTTHFIQEEGRRLESVFLTRIDENELGLLTVEEGGDLVGRIVVVGARRAVEERGGRLRGLVVHWDADAFRVE